ncbi:MAG TPA: hypothetical protein V6D22_03185 [Candidatus Obscuribacterales bacterium]
MRIILLCFALIFGLFLVDMPSCVASGGAKAIVVLFEDDPWLMVIGSDSPVFVLYDDGTVIFAKHRRVGPTEYYVAKLPEQEKQQLVHSLLDGIGSAQDRYELTRATDQPTNIVWVKDGQIQKRVEVYGDLDRDYASFGPSSTPAPPKVLSAFRQLSTFDRIGAKVWLPDYIEVMIWPFPLAREKSIKWPADWPDLDDPRTVRRRHIDSIYLRSQHLGELREMLGKRKPSAAIGISGLKWSVSYRYPFPDEETVRAVKMGFRAPLPGE